MGQVTMADASPVKMSFNASRIISIGASPQRCPRHRVHSVHETEVQKFHIFREPCPRPLKEAATERKVRPERLKDFMSPTITGMLLPQDGAGP